MDDTQLLFNRLTELYKKSYEGGYYLFSDFLGLMEQSVFNDVRRQNPTMRYTVFGGCEGAERVMIRFGDEEELGYTADFPIVTLRIAPTAPRYADRLTHRDFLGAILNLGIERSRLGDIPIKDNVAYLFCKEDIADYIVDSLTRVKHTDVTVTRTDALPAGELYRTERVRIQAVGERVDAIVAKVFSLSRDEAQGYFKKRLVFIDGRLCENTSYLPKLGEVVSVRGKGRFIYRGYSTLSKKGKLNLEVDLYI